MWRSVEKRLGKVPWYNIENDEQFTWMIEGICWPIWHRVKQKRPKKKENSDSLIEDKTKTHAKTQWSVIFRFCIFFFLWIYTISSASSNQLQFWWRNIVVVFFVAVCVCVVNLFCFVLFFPFFLGYFGNLDLIDFKTLEQRTTSMHSSETAIESKLLLSTTTIFPKPKMVKRL